MTIIDLDAARRRLRPCTACGGYGKKLMIKPVSARAVRFDFEGGRVEFGKATVTSQGCTECGGKGVRR